jgi:hypothetical protein
MKAQLFKEQEIQHYWHLQEQDRGMDFKYNVRTQSLRFYNALHRILMLEEAGILRGRITINNEYSQSVGKIVFNPGGNSGGMILLDNKKYFFNKVRHSVHIRAVDVNKKDLELLLTTDSHTDVCELAALMIAAILFKIHVEHPELIAA